MTKATGQARSYQKVINSISAYSLLTAGQFLCRQKRSKGVFIAYSSIKYSRFRAAEGSRYHSFLNYSQTGVRHPEKP